MGDKNSLKRKNRAVVIFKTERFDNINSAVIIKVSKEVQNCLALSCLHCTAESMLSKRPVLRIIVALFVLIQILLFSDENRRKKSGFRAIS